MANQWQYSDSDKLVLVTRLARKNRDMLVTVTTLNFEIRDSPVTMTPSPRKNCDKLVIVTPLSRKNRDKLVTVTLQNWKTCDKLVTWQTSDMTVRPSLHMIRPIWLTQVNPHALKPPLESLEAFFGYDHVKHRRMTAPEIKGSLVLQNQLETWLLRLDVAKVLAPTGFFFRATGASPYCDLIESWMVNW